LIARIAVGAVIVDTLDINTGLEFLEYFAAHNFKPLSGFIVFVSGFFANDYGSVPFKTCFLYNIIK